MGDWDGQFCAPNAGTQWSSFLTNIEVPSDLKTADHPKLLAPTGANADRWHVATAKETNLTLVTNEGFTKDGYGTERMWKWAQREGVPIAFPKDVYAGIDETFAAHAFLRRLREHAPSYIARRKAEHGHEDKVYVVVSDMHDYWRHILLGETTDPMRRARVSL